MSNRGKRETATAQSNRRRIAAIIAVAIVLYLGLSVASARLGAYVLRFKCYYLAAGAMAPTLQRNDRVIVDKMAYVRQSPRREEIIVFQPPHIQIEKTIIKRVVAVGGDQLLIEDGQLYVNNMETPVSEPYILEPMWYRFPQDGEPYAVPVGHVFVLGDNRNDSLDSHRFGSVPEDSIIGRVVAIYYPPSRMRTF